MNFEFNLPTKLIFGKGSLKRLHQLNLPYKRALIVISSGKSMKSNGYLELLEKELEANGIRSVLFDKILPNPIKRHIMEGAALARREKCDCVIGLGGGSSIDSAKVIAAMATNDGDFWDYVSGGTGKGMPMPNNPLPIIAITTTAGTGTEVDPWAVITNEETEEKIGFGYEKTFPIISIVDPELMRTVPRQLTAYQGFDALFHSIEGYLNHTATPVSDLFSLKSIELIYNNLERAFRNGDDMEAREAVALGNTYAGIVEFTSGCISEHSIEHAMSALHPELPHGAGLIMISRAYYMNYINQGIATDRFIQMAKAMGRKEAAHPKEFLELLEELMVKCQVNDLKMSDYGICKEEIPAIVLKAKVTMGGLFEVDPIAVSEADCRKILLQSFR